MILKEVTPSGTVGKQVFATTNKPVKLHGFTASPSGANLTVKIRDGGANAASGEVVFFGRFLSAQGARQVSFEDPMYFTKGLHVTVIGANGAAYLELV